MRIESFGRRSLEEQSTYTMFRALFAPDVQLDEQVTLLETLNRRDLRGNELAHMARLLLDECLRVEGAPGNAVDLCGTGGDCSGTFNISTVAAFVVAGAGFPVVKHGNRSISSKCGSVDCLEELGVTAALQPGDVLSFLEDTGIAFLFAPVFHPLVGAVTKARRALAARGCKTVFNVLGPLVNPAFVSRRSLGVFCEDLIMPVAEALKELGVRKAMVYHGDGQDEVTLTGVTLFARLSNGEITRGRLSPEEAGFVRCAKEELDGGGAADNARIAREILGERLRDARRDIVVLNAAVGIQVAADEELGIQDCVARATDSIDSGRAVAVLRGAVERSRL